MEVKSGVVIHTDGGEGGVAVLDLVCEQHVSPQQQQHLHVLLAVDVVVLVRGEVFRLAD